VEKKRAGYTCPGRCAHDPAVSGVRGWGTNGPVNRIRRVPPRKTVENHISRAASGFSVEILMCERESERQRETEKQSLPDFYLINDNTYIL